jgi:predicted NBD/HSP70 family sugar kinase
MNLPALLDIAPQSVPPFDPGFRPIGLAFERYGEAVRRSAGRVPLRIAVERENGFISAFETEILPDGVETTATGLIVERLVKFLLWARGGWRVFLHGPSSVAGLIRTHYAAGGPRGFDVQLMSGVYERDFEVRVVGASEVPQANESRAPLGGHLDGCRIGFDLGASDYKIAAVRDGKLVFSEEIPWAPSEQTDPEYHERHIRAGLKKAAEHLPRVDAIGGSAAGIYIDNQVRIASLFRGLSPEAFEARTKDMFRRLAREWNVPFEVTNDGEVTALAGTLALEEKAMLGVAMGSSQAAGFLASDGHLPGWLDELAFVPVDINPAAVLDEWSGDRGVGATYFSQQAVNKLALAAGFMFPADMRLPERLKRVQEMAEGGDPRALGIFDAIGVYLGYTIPWYRVFYDFRNLLVLGRVMSGAGGNRIADRAVEVLRTEFPATHDRVKVHLVDERIRRVGQAFAAATLPELRPAGARRGDSP